MAKKNPHYQALEVLEPDSKVDIELGQQPHADDNVFKYMLKKVSSLKYWKTMMASMIFRIIGTTIVISALMYTMHVSADLNTMMGRFDEFNKLLFMSISKANAVDVKYEMIEKRYEAILSPDLENKYKSLEATAQVLSDKLSKINPANKKITVHPFKRTLLESDFFHINGRVTTTVALHVDCPANTVRVGCGSMCENLSNTLMSYPSNNYPENESTCVGICIIGHDWVNTSPLTVWATCMDV